MILVVVPEESTNGAQRIIDLEMIMKPLSDEKLRGVIAHMIARAPWCMEVLTSVRITLAM